MAIANALQLEGRPTSRQSFWANVYTAGTLQHAVLRPFMSCVQGTCYEK